MTAPQAVPLVDEDFDPDRGAEADESPLQCKSPGCQNPVVKPARGRTPQFCPEHRETAKTKTGARKTVWPEADNVENALRFAIRAIGSGVMLVDQFDGRVIASGSENVAHEIVELLRKPRFREQRDFITRLAKPGDFGPLVMALLPIIVPILAHHKLLPQFVIPGLVTDPASEGVNR